MNKKEIAKLLARACVSCTEGLRFAIQLFIEDIILPDNCKSYTEKEMENFILKYLN